MKKLPILIIFCVAFLFMGCEKDVIGEAEDPIIIQPEPTELKLGNISGIVFDENNDPVENAIIEYSRETYATDVNGYFKIENTGASADGGLIKINKDGYFENFKFVFIETQQTSHLRVQLIEKDETNTLNGANGGVINIDGGGKITFPERSLVDENNISYEGEATIFTHWYNPKGNNLFTSMPGDLRGVDQNGKVVQLSTYGMMAVEIYSSTGQKLNLAEDKTATIEFPLPQSLLNNAPSEIPTWSLDESTGVWIEESIANLNNGNYIAEVSHFSFWNCDIPANLIKLKGKIVNTDGEALPWYRILVTVKNSGACRGGYTNSNGIFCGFVPKNSNLILQVKDECGGIIYEEEIGPYSVDTDLETIEVSNSLESQTLVTGSLVCEGQPIPNGYAKLTLSNGVIYIAETDENGDYSIFVEGCGLNQITVQGIDIENNRTSGIVTIDLSNGESQYNIVPFEVCQELDEYIQWKQNGGSEELFVDPVARIINGNLEIIAQLPINIVHTSIVMTLPNVTIGDNLVTELQSTIVNNGNTINGFCGQDQTVNCDNVTADISELGGLDQYVVGTFTGEVANTNGESESIMGEFRIRIDQIAQTNEVSGVVWADENEDGIRQTGEQPLQDIRVNLLETSRSTFTNENGEYSFDRIFDTQVSLEVELESGFQLSIANQGTDDSIDSDFEDNPQDITFTSGQTLNNFDAGIHPDGDLICLVEVSEFPTCPNNDPFATVSVTIDRGSPPYTVEFDGNQVANSNDTNFEIPEVSIGEVIQYTITGSNGKSCSGEFDLRIIDTYGCEIESTNSTQGQNNGTATVLPFGDLISSAVWSNGATEISISNLAPGTYSVTVTSPNGCTSECNTVIEEDDLSCEIIGPDVVCSDFANYELIVETNDPMVTYLWSNNETTQSISLSGLASIGTYTVTVTNSNGSTTFCTQTITNNSSLACTAVAENTTCDQDNGTANVATVGGIPPYTYMWNNGSIISNITGLSPGTYSVTVTDDVGCETTCSVFVQDSEPIECNLDVTPINCNTASVEANINGGSGDYQYLWNTGTTGMQVIYQTGITCNLTVTDNNTGCTTTCEAFIESQDGITCQIIPTTGNCGNNDSSAFVEVFDGSGNYSYQWSNGADTEEVFNLASATYSVTVTDNESGCVTTCETQIISSSPLEAQIISEQDCDEPEYFTNMVVLATGGSGTYTYAWSNGGTESETEIETLGLFSVTVTDSQGCTVETEIEIVPSSSRIGNYVWLDSENGQQDIFDQGIDQGLENVSMLLFSSDINGVLTGVDSTFTDVEGFYEFKNLEAGNYIVQIVTPPNMQLVQPNGTMDIELDSNFDPNTRRSEIITVDGCERNTTIDAGLREN